MQTSKYHSQLQQLTEQPLFSLHQAKEMGIPPRMLVYFQKQGLIRRAGKGIYYFPQKEVGIDIQWEDLAYTMAGIPNGVICLISALYYYGMTDQIMREFWVAVPNCQWAPKRKNTRIMRMRDLTTGLTSIRMGPFTFRIFDRERTLIDAFRFLSAEIAVKALKIYLKGQSGKKSDIPKLSRYAKVFGIDIQPYLLALTT